MPRPRRPVRARAEIPNHIVIRGNNRRRIFSYPTDRMTFLRYLANALEKTACRLHAIALLANHVHLSITPPSVPALSELMRGTCWYYARYRNRRTRGSGKLFEQRFWSRPLKDWNDVANVTAYIDLNPFGTVYGKPAHSWSSVGLHLAQSTRIPVDIWHPSSWYLALGRDVSERTSAYSVWLQEFQARKYETLVDAPPAAKYQEHRGRLERPDGSSAR